MRRELALASGLDQAARAREFVRATLPAVVERPVPTRFFEDVETVVSELVTNALIHAAAVEPTHAAVLLVLESDELGLRIGVTDRADTAPTPRTAGEDDTHGRGLTIVALLAADWGVEPVAGGVGKTVWARFGVPAGALDDASLGGV